MAPRLRTALIGYGTAGSVFHAPLIDAADGLELTAVVTRDPERRRRLAERYPAVRVLDTAEQVTGRPDDHDLVVVATPHESHVPLAAAALDAGLAVVVDKPLSLTAAGAREITALDARHGGRTAVFHNRRWDGDFRTVAALVEDGTLGEVHHFASHFDRWRPRPRPGAWRELRPADQGGGLLNDLGSHLVDQAVQLFGPVERVYAELDTRRAGLPADDDAFLVLRHAGGVRSVLSASATAADHLPRFQVRGSKGAYTKDGLDGQEAALRAGVRPGDPGWAQEPAQSYGLLHTGGTPVPVPTLPGRWDAFYPGVAAALRDPAATMPVPPGETVHVLDVVEAARASARQARVVRL